MESVIYPQSSIGETVAMTTGLLSSKRTRSKVFFKTVVEHCGTALTSLFGLSFLNAALKNHP